MLTLLQKKINGNEEFRKSYFQLFHGFKTSSEDLRMALRYNMTYELKFQTPQIKHTSFQ